MVTVRDATPADLTTCLDIIRLLPDFFTPDVPDIVRREFDEHTCWVITKASEVIGFALVDERSALAAEILWAAVHPDHRNHGHGAVLIGYVLDVLARNGLCLAEVKTLWTAPAKLEAGSLGSQLVRGVAPHDRWNASSYSHGGTFPQ